MYGDDERFSRRAAQGKWQVRTCAPDAPDADRVRLRVLGHGAPAPLAPPWRPTTNQLSTFQKKCDLGSPPLFFNQSKNWSAKPSEIFFLRNPPIRGDIVFLLFENGCWREPPHAHCSGALSCDAGGGIARLLRRLRGRSARLRISMARVARVGVSRAESQGRGGERRGRDCDLVLCRAGAVRGRRERFGQYV